MIYLYNTRTRKKEEFTPRNEGAVGLYTCGPTVYDYQHIGNMRAYITWDVLKRFLQSQGYTVTHIMNITDVGHLTSDADSGEDKMEVAKARERQTAWEVAEKYFEAFQESLKRLNIIPPTKFVKATDTIDEQIAFVKELDEKGYLYKTSDGLYFDTSKDPEYGQIGKLDLAGLREGARVEQNPEKKHASDFAVWKFSPEGKQRDMEWDSPWGTGFPGWHLECSVIARTNLGDQFDIHTGGIDHTTVHHPNEIAQSKAVTGKVPARYWLHNNFLHFQDKKMAKSAGTFVRLADIEAGGVSSIAYRYFVMQTHYRKELTYSWEALQAAHQGLLNVYRDISFFAPAEGSCPDFEKKFFAALSDDLNTSKALDILHRLIKSREPSAHKHASLLTMDSVLGLNLESEWKRRQELPEAAYPILKEREAARAKQDFITSDTLREKLAALGVEVMDTNEGQRAVIQ